MGEIHAVIQDEVVLGRLSRKVGGRRIYIPKSQTERSEELRELLGDDLDRLQKEFPGLYVWVPSGRKPGPQGSPADRALRDAAIRSMAGKVGKTELVMKFGLSRTQISKILNKKVEGQ